MGTQTQQDKAGNKYEVKPQYEELHTPGSIHIIVNWDSGMTGIDQQNFHSAQLDYLKLLQMGTQTQQDKAGNKYEVKPQYEELSKQLGGRHSHPVVTAPTIALDFSDTTQQSASHNVAPNQIPSSSETSEIVKRRRIASSAQLNYQTSPKRQRINACSWQHTQAFGKTDFSRQVVNSTQIYQRISLDKTRTKI
ncbi:hypothetical protein F511_12218 [Dorcoceras hygrometricum]|uniref:Uncharacterized protein n=1 Tax=Dorcoceras hygrometricum TaxID=472368 RepID=A0A2Z7DEI7_9LAMI|nr:hypothetical protein F511_12218 [Dorcoceras hygrometricum]